MFPDLGELRVLLQFQFTANRVKVVVLRATRLPKVDTFPPASPGNGVWSKRPSQKINTTANTWHFLPFSQSWPETRFRFCLQNTTCKLLCWEKVFQIQWSKPSTKTVSVLRGMKPFYSTCQVTWSKATRWSSSLSAGKCCHVMKLWVTYS